MPIGTRRDDKREGEGSFRSLIEPNPSVAII
jgi:hypothetical protein